MPSVDILKIDGASASINEKLKASIGIVKLAMSTHTTANNIKPCVLGEIFITYIYKVFWLNYRT